MTYIYKASIGEIRLLIDVYLPTGKTLKGFSIYFNERYYNAVDTGYLTLLNMTITAVSEDGDMGEGFYINKAQSPDEKYDNESTEVLPPYNIFFAIHGSDIVVSSDGKLLKEWLRNHAGCCKIKKGNK